MMKGNRALDTLGRRLIYVGALAPLAMAAPVIASFFASDYDWVSQHMSELQLRGDAFSVIVHVSALLAGVALLSFALGVLLKGGPFTAFSAMAFGIGMVTNGVFPMGSPLHGFYGIAMFSVLTPALFVGEFAEASRSKSFRAYSYLTAVVSLAYLWMLVVGIEPAGTSGLTQRLGTLVGFVWYAVAARRIAKAEDGPECRSSFQ
ncbi:MAG: DUF998 domain-containing protein [Pseudomonadota bacterium]